MNLDNDTLLARAIDFFIKETKLTPVIGTELEFYISPDKDIDIKELSTIINQRTKSLQLPPITIDKEKVKGQYEFRLDSSKDLLLIAKATTLLPNIINNYLNEKRQSLILDAKPFKNKPGSGMHINISLLGKDNLNQFMRTEKKGEKIESPTMLKAIAGLEASLQESISTFAPNEEDYKRFKPSFDAPTTISWGGNNRTVALRIPASSWILEPTRHIEHRVPAATANPYMSIIAVLAGIHYGLTSKINEPKTPKIYGDASMDMYHLNPISPSLAEARKQQQKGKIIESFIQSLYAHEM